MRRSLLIFAVLLCVGAPAALAVQAAPARDSAHARLAECHVALVQKDRYAVFNGSMHALAAGEQMEMRFDLLARRSGHSAFRRVTVPGSGLGVWNASDAGVTRYRFHQRVENLSAPAAYRALVRFRWRNGSGDVVARTRRLTGVCNQPDLRPELRVSGVSATPGPGPTTARYAVVVRNAGGSPAANFDVAFAVGSAIAPSQTVVGLAPNSSRVLVFTAQRCTGTIGIGVVLDPDNRVVERNELNNERTYPCPL